MVLKLNLFTFLFVCLAFLSTDLSYGQEGFYATPSAKLKLFCEKLDKSFKKYKWGSSDCENFGWYHIRNSVKGDPLAWTIFGDIGADADKDGLAKKDVTMVMCGVHGDEITPIKFCFDLMEYLKTSLKENEFKKNFENKIVIVVPLVNPDSYFKPRPTRTNASGVDVNRNFPTNDWFKDAQKMWISKYRKDKRRNPGKAPNSEPETIFQVNLIKRYMPDKIISVHSPLSLIDYDGPSLGAKEDKAQELLIQMSKDAADYKIKNYPFFPGSLGNWAGQERGIPTYTLELPTSDPSKSREYWNLFKEAMHKAVFHDLGVNISQAQDSHTVIDQKNPVTEDGSPQPP